MWRQTVKNYAFFKAAAYAYVFGCYTYVNVGTLFIEGTIKTFLTIPILLAGLIMLRW